MEKIRKGQTNGIDKMFCNLAFNSLMDKPDYIKMDLVAGGGKYEYKAVAKVDQESNIQQITVYKNGKMLGRAQYDLDNDASPIFEIVGFR